jgi:hypothetical protein
VAAEEEEAAEEPNAEDEAARIEARDGARREHKMLLRRN